MADISKIIWFMDLKNMVCRNVINDVVVGFEQRGNKYYGQIVQIPEEILFAWANNEKCNKLVRKTIKQAEKVFMKEIRKIWKLMTLRVLKGLLRTRY